MEIYQKGDETAFRELFRRHKNGVYHYIYRHTSQSEDSEEIFQTVFVKLHRAAPQYSPTAKFTTWLYTIVRNLCIDHHRKKRSRYPLSIDALNEETHRSLHDVLSSHAPDSEDQLGDQEIGKVIEEILTKINEDQREVFLMREKAGLKFEEIAKILGLSVNTVKSRMRYALESLKKLLEKSSLRDLKLNARR